MPTELVAEDEEQAIQLIRAKHPTAEVVEAFEHCEREPFGWAVLVWATERSHGRDIAGEEAVNTIARYFVYPA